MRSSTLLLVVILCIAAITVHPTGLDAAGAWTALGPDTADVTTVAIDPGAPWNLFVGTSGGGVFVSRDGGHTWQRSNAGITDLDVSEIALAPQEPDTVYAATASGLFRSHDRGTRWERVATAALACVVGCVAVDPNLPQTVYLADWNEIHRSDDGGTSWMTILDSNTGGLSVANGVWIHPQDPSFVVVADNFEGFFTSRDGGATWHHAAPPQEYRVRRMAFDPRDADRILATANNGYVLESQDRGTTWTEISRVPVRWPPELLFDPATPGTLYAFSTWELYVSRDDGLTWEPLPALGEQAFPGALGTCVEASALTMVFAGARGVKASSDGGASWTPLSGPLDAAQVAAVHVDPRDPDRIWATTPSSGLFATTDRGATWSSGFEGIPPGGANVLVADPHDPDTMIAGAAGGLYRSTDGGLTWLPLTPDSTPFSAARILTAAATVPTTWYANAWHDGVYRSRDQGSTWEKLADERLSDLYGGLTPSPHDPDTVLVSVKSEQILVTHDGGDSWSRSAAGLPYDQSIQSFAFDPSRPEVAWAGGWHGEIYRSEDDGQSWVVAGQLASNSTVNVLAVEPGDGDRIWAAGQGVSLSTDGGETWEPVPGGLVSPTVTALELVQTAAGTRVVIGTYGGGVLALDSTPPRRPSGRPVPGPGAAATRHP